MYVRRNEVYEMMHNRLKLIREKSFLAAQVVPSIAKDFSVMPDALYHLVQQKHGAMSGPIPICHGRKRKQDFD
jgi:hypothetical protein